MRVGSFAKRYVYTAVEVVVILTNTSNSMNGLALFEWFADSGFEWQMILAFSNILAITCLFLVLRPLDVQRLGPELLGKTTKAQAQKKYKNED